MSFGSLEGALRGLGRRAVVIVSDRYPPHAHGGAEVSLHIALRSLEDSGERLVVAFGDRELSPTRYTVDGVDVLLLPRQGRWPWHGVPRAALSRAERLPSALRRPALGMLRRGFGPLPTRVAPEDLELAETVRDRVRPRGGAVIDFVEYDGGLAASLLRRTLEHCRPEILHADNFRAILTAASASHRLPLRRVGVVRDNRFHCVRHDQSVRVNGALCGPCALSCAPEDAPSAPELQRESLRRSRETRLAALRAMDRVVVTSRYLWDAIGPLVGDERLVRIPNAPDDVTLVDGYAEGVPELPGTNVLIVGMINENKGQLELARRLDALVARVPDVRLHFAGRGPRIQRAMIQAAERSGHADRLVFHGFVDRRGLYELYRRCQIVALPTMWPEPFGRVPLEAGVARRPVVAFAVGGLRESVRDGETGFSIPPADFDAFIAALGKLADDVGLQRRMGHAAREHVLRAYPARRLARELTRVWRELRSDTRG